MDNNKKQTAVEWLVEHLIEYGFELEEHKNEIKQAKETEKEQIMNAYCEKMGMMHNEKWKEMIKEQAKQYYNETYES